MWGSIDTLQCLVEGMHVNHVSILLCPLCKSGPPIILHGPKLSLECAASSLVCSLRSLIVRFSKQMIVAGVFLFEQLFSLSASNQSWCFFCSCHTMNSFLHHDLEIVLHPWVQKFVHLQFLRLGTFPLGRKLQGKGDFAAYQPMISLEVCTGHHSGV